MLLPSQCGFSRSYVGTKEELDSRIFSTKHGYLPWIARIGVEYHGVNTYYCTGTLIHERIILTAAHCGKQAEL